MATGTLIVNITLPAGMTAEVFEDRLKTEVFPAVHKGPTRVGEIESWTVLRPESADEDAGYVWLIDWGGLSQAVQLAAEALEKLRSMGAQVESKSYSIADELARGAAASE